MNQAGSQDIKTLGRMTDCGDLLIRAPRDGRKERITQMRKRTHAMWNSELEQSVPQHVRQTGSVGLFLGLSSRQIFEFGWKRSRFMGSRDNILCY